MTTLSPIARLNDYGQSPWYDNIRRSLLEGGDLARMIEEDGIRGVTSNPTIFEKAISSGNEYDDVIHSLARQGLASEEIGWELLIADVGTAADILRPAHDAEQRANLGGLHAVGACGVPVGQGVQPGVPRGHGAVRVRVRMGMRTLVRGERHLNECRERPAARSPDTATGRTGPDLARPTRPSSVPGGQDERAGRRVGLGGPEEPLHLGHQVQLAERARLFVPGELAARPVAGRPTGAAGGGGRTRPPGSAGPVAGRSAPPGTRARAGPRCPGAGRCAGPTGPARRVRACAW